MVDRSSCNSNRSRPLRLSPPHRRPSRRRRRLRASRRRRCGSRPVQPTKQKNPAATNPLTQPLKATRFAWRDPSTIPPRQFLYGRHCARGFVSVTAAQGGIGKSSLELTEAIAIGTGRDLLGVRPWERAPVWYLGLEDPLDEYQRRVAAISLHYGIPGAELERALFLELQAVIRISSSRWRRRTNQDRRAEIASIVANVRQQKIALVIVDPFVACHAVNENDNAKLEKVMRAWARVANQAGCAVELVHHFRKSGGNPGSIADDVAARPPLSAPPAPSASSPACRRSRPTRRA